MDQWQGLLSVAGGGRVSLSLGHMEATARALANTYQDTAPPHGTAPSPSRGHVIVFQMIGQSSARGRPSRGFGGDPRHCSPAWWSGHQRDWRATISDKTDAQAIGWRLSPEMPKVVVGLVGRQVRQTSDVGQP